MATSSTSTLRSFRQSTCSTRTPSATLVSFVAGAQAIYTVLSDVVHGEVIGLAKDRTRDSLAGLLTTCLDLRQRSAVEAVGTDMHQPYVKAVGEVLPKAAIVFDKFHVLFAIIPSASASSSR